MIDDWDISRLRLNPGSVLEPTRTPTPTKVAKRREHFVRVPWSWVERLAGASSVKTVLLALHLLYRHWKGKGEPIKLANGMLRIDGISRYAKRRALGELESLGLITVERRPKRSPIVRVLY